MLGTERLSRKLLLSLAASLGIASLAFLALFIATYRMRLAEERGNASEQVNRLLQVALENAMLKRDLAGLQDIVDRLGKQPRIARVMIANPDLIIRFASARSLIDTVLTGEDVGCKGCAAPEIASRAPTSMLMTHKSGSEVLRSVNPIANRDVCKECHGAARDRPVNGILVVDHEADSIRSDAFVAAGALSGAGLAVVLLGLAGHWRVLRQHVVRPISELQSASRALADGKLSERVAISPNRDDEVRDLALVFNKMAERIEMSVSEMRRQEAFLKALMDTVPDGLRVIDEDKRVILANASMARQMGIERAAVIGQRCYELHGRDAPCPPTLVTCPFHAINIDGEPIRYVHRHLRKDGSEIHVETTAAKLTIDGDGGKRVLIIEAIRDLEEQIKYSHEQRLSEIGQLAAGVAHEIYNPLASVQIGLQALLRSSPDIGMDPQAASYLGMIENEMQKCIGVAKRLLDLSQVPSNSTQLVSVSTIIPEVASLLAYEAEQRNVEVDLRMPPRELRVLATDAEIRMVALNLMQNAFHAMPNGGRLTIVGEDVGGAAILRFSDTGVGIDAADVRHIFEPFFSRRADGVSGTGLGLTISKSIVSRYDGSISVDSSKGVGSVFTVTLPSADRGEIGA